MKGKAFKLKIILSLMLVLTASLCFGLSIAPKARKEKSTVVAASTKVELGSPSAKEEFSALFDGDIIFSAEKVRVNSEEYEDGIPKPLATADKQFYATYDATVENETFSFKNIQNETSNKTVIDNGGFAKLDNIYEGEVFNVEGEPYYQEAVLVSFGSYIYLGEDLPIGVSDNANHAGITYLDVAIYQNGVKLDKSQVPELRNIRPSGNDGGTFLDFTFLITQKPDASNEGYYELNFVYMVNNQAEKASFGFYIINNTSYTQNANPESKDFGYNAKPTLGWIDKNSQNFEKDAVNKEDYVRYYIGNSGLGSELSYPTITYDYTKYNLSYVHTANQKNTTYNLRADITSNAGGKIAKMISSVSSSGATKSIEYALNDYQEKSINLVTIMLTEPGTYVFEYDFVYDGYVGTTAPDPAFETEVIKLSIHGLSTNYSKSGYESAKMQYFEITTQPSNHVDLIIPNGYKVGEDTSSMKDKELGFMYSLVQSDSREGSVVTTNSKDALINSYLNDEENVINLGLNLNETYYNYLTANYEDYTKAENLSKILEALEKDEMYAKTNQGSLWLKGNDEYTEESYYFYSPSPLKVTDLFDDTESTKIKLTNTTSFSSKGYYLVFVEVSPNQETSGEYYQVFAFQYTSSSINIKIETKDENGEMKAVPSGKYTNKEVLVSWEKPGVFDRDVKAYYYSVTNRNLTKEQLVETTKHVLVADGEKDNYYHATLGENVTEGNFVRYLIRLESEGESATHKVFTIDKQGITGIQAYLVQEMYSGNTVYYSYATDRNGYSISIPNGITDGYATLAWNDKASDAKIYATYSYTPFAISSDSEDVSRTINGNDGKKWISTNYKLGTTIVGADLEKSSSPYLIDSECVLFNQGIYIIDLWDDAGNESRYAFIIDRTNNYFNVEGSCVSNVSLLYGDNVNFSVGDYKVFDLDVETITNETLKEFILKASADKLNEFEGYYTGNNTNVRAISKFFQKLASEDNYYFTVENTKVVAFNGLSEDASIKVDDSGDGQLTYSETSSTYYKRTIYVVSENHTYTTEDIKTHSYVTVEINKDNARGSVYYSNDSGFDNIPLDGMDSDNYPKLGTGSDTEKENGLYGAEATSAKHVAFVWNIGTGSFEVKTVKYSYYTLKTNKDRLDDLFYYYLSEEDVELYNNGTWNTALGAELMDDNSGRGIVRFNRTSDTKAGLYIVTREYKEVVGADLGDDVRVKNYYFIVDRNGIIETGIGDSIRINLMEQETEFNSFSTQGAEKGVLRTDDGIEGDSYSIYLTTTKLPATLTIPTGKYYSTVGTSAKYAAGRLNVSVYFNDKYNQLTNQFRGKTIKIYASNGTEQKSNNEFNIDIYEYLTKTNQQVRDRITESKENGQWLFLPGDYIIRITDNVVNALGENHVKYIGLRIATYEDNGPEVEFFTGYSKDNMTKVVAEENNATVSQEFLKVVLPAYNNNETRKAQVDNNYIVVDQYLDGVKKEYLYYPYKQESGIPLNGDPSYSKYVTIDSNGTEDDSDDKINVWLDTKLRDGLGNIDYANLTRPLYYTVTVRYKLNDETLPYADDLKTTQLEKYKNCYVYYTANGVRVDNFYYKTYTITIDREAPKENINYLNANDRLVNDYNNEFGSSNMLEGGIHETNSNLYFTNQYAKYYQDGKNRENIYIYHVNENTLFNVKDVYRVYVKEISDISSLYLSLPISDTSAYRNSVLAYELDDNRDGYGVYSGLVLDYNNYYEIVEIDTAGNATQYVIFYSNDDAVVSIPFSVTTTLNESKTINISSNEIVNENIFKIESQKEVLTNNARFLNFKVEVERADGTRLFKTLTNLSTDNEKLTEDIAEVLLNEGFGSFNIKISTQSSSSISHIKLYNEEIIDSLKSDRIVKDENGRYYKNSSGKDSIFLHGANKVETIDGQDVDFYATEITIKTAEKTTTYIAEVQNNGTVKYFEAGTNKEVVHIELKRNTTYLITMKDVFGFVPPYRFNTSGYEFVIVDFEDVDSDESKDYYHEINGENHMYYGYTSATLKYDKTIYSSEVAKKEATGYQNIALTPETVDGSYEQYSFAAEDNAKVEYRVKLYYEGELEYTYFITIDTRLSNVSLRDSSSGAEKDLIEIFNNVNYTTKLVLPKSDSGRMTLYWNIIEENNYFDYDYRLYEELKEDKGFRKYKIVDGFYVESEDGEIGLNLNGKTSTIIATREDSLGIYKFVISVYGKDGTYLGNRVYAFMVQEVDTQVYYIINQNGEEIRANATFKHAELKPEHKINDIFYRKKEGGVDELLVGTNVNLPLYITNEDCTIRTTSLNVTTEGPFEIELDANNKLCIYKISKEDAYDIFIGILKVKPTQNLVENVVVNSTQVATKTSFTFAGNRTDEVVIQADRIIGNNAILAKNKLMIDVMYNGEKVNSQEFNSQYTIQGNGQYSFVFRDLAGNVHEYTQDEDKNTPETKDELKVYVLREVVVMLNGQAPVKNAFYNDEVSLTIYATSKFETGSISVRATRNGSQYTPKGFNPYVFSDYGTYRVIVKAKYPGLEEELTNVVTFTILNVNEAATSMDLTGLKSSNISKVLNPKGEDVTTKFVNLLIAGGMKISHEDIMKYESTASKEDKLNVTTGKMTFTLTYLVSDEIYPDRELTVKFTLNNEKPTVVCSLEKGEKTTKGFTIKFNEAVIYDQIGESYIYINDQLVAHITEKSANAEQKISTTFKEYGEGDYYVKLVSSSGVILDSYKVTIEEPLNTWAIIVIIAIVGVVSTVVITIIVLRRKMRIR